MNEVITLDESFFNDEPTIIENKKQEENQSETILPQAQAPKEIGTLTLEDLDAIDNEGIEIEQPEAVIDKEPATKVVKEENKSKLYASQVEYFKQKGLLPEGFELEDGVEWDEDTFEEALEIMAEGLHKNIETDVRGEFESKLGTNIIQFLENGGDYSTFAELIKEQNVVQNFDITTDYGQKAVVKKYYSEVLKWSEARVEKHIDRLFNDGDLEEESTNLKGEFDKYFLEEQETLIQQQEEIQKKQERILAQRKNNLAKTLQETDGVTQKEINVMIDYVFADAYKLPTGAVIPKLDYDILKLQNDPKELADLVQFLTDKEGFLKRKATEINNVKVDKKFKQIVQNQVSIKGGGSAVDSNKPKSKFKTILT